MSKKYLYSIVLLIAVALTTNAFMSVNNGQSKHYLPYEETYEKDMLEDFDDTFPADLLPINANSKNVTSMFDFEIDEK